MTRTKQEALDIFIALLKEQTPPVPVRTEHELFLLSWCGEHAMGGFFYKFKDKYFSKDFSTYLTSIHKTNLQRNLIFLQEYQNIKNLCAEKGLPAPVALKGLALLQRVHALGERPLTDMDLYYPSDQMEDFKDLILSVGFSPVPEKKWRANHHKSTFKKFVMGLEITLEMHTQLFYNQPLGFQPPTITYGDMIILSPEMELVYLSAHLVHQHTFLKLFWLMDLHHITRKNPSVWQPWVWQMAQELRVKTSLTAVGFCLKSLLGHAIAVPSRFLPLKYFLKWPTLILLNESRVKYLCMKHTAKDSLRESLSYDLRWLYFRMETSLFAKSKDNDMAL